MARTSGSYSELTEPRIRAEATRLFAQKGYASVSMREIAQAVGVQAGALYNYTADKQTLLFSLLETHMHDLLAHCPDFRNDETPVMHLEAFVRFHIEFHIARRDAVFLSYMELRNLTQENFAKIEHLRQTYEGKLRDILERGRVDQSFEVQDAKVASFAIIGMLKEMATWYRPEGPLSHVEISSLYWTMVKNMVRGGRDADRI